MHDYFVDLHIHIGRTSKGEQVKYAAAKNLTFENIAEECLFKKGINMISIIDCSSPRVMDDMKILLEKGLAEELTDGGILYKNKLCIIPGAEIETWEKGDNGESEGHTLCYFPTSNDISAFSGTMTKYIKNINLSSQRAHLPVKELLDIVEEYNGIMVPAHVFSPHKGYYGNCVDRLVKLFGDKFYKIFAVELGLSADTTMADQISELEDKTFLSSSDAHSLPKIAREYNLMTMENPNFSELIKVLKRQEGRKVRANYGLNPKLGKYHRTFCEKCDETIPQGASTDKCLTCGGKTTAGVFDRIEEIKDKKVSTSPSHRPPYVHQIPLEYIPGLGPKSIERLISRLGSEMDILHHATKEEMLDIVKEEIAENIIKGREGRLDIKPGGGGIYGRIK